MDYLNNTDVLTYKPVPGDEAFKTCIQNFMAAIATPISNFGNMTTSDDLIMDINGFIDLVAKEFCP